MKPLVALALLVISIAVVVVEGPTTEPAVAGSIPFTVNSNSDAPDTDPSDNFCVVASGHCTLRAAIEEANEAPEIHDIHFDLPNCPGGGCVISPATPLPPLESDHSQIDGTTQPGYSGEPLVVVDGSGAGDAAHGIQLAGSNQLIRGLEIRNFALDGVVTGGLGPAGPWEVSLNFIHDNRNGVVALDCTGGLSVLSNAITDHSGDNAAGVASCGPDIDVHFNRFYGNFYGVTDSGLEEIADADNNWWGCNAGPADAACDPANGPVDYEPWLTLDVKATPASIPGGGTSGLTGMVTEDSNGFDTSPFGHILDGTPVSFSTDLGSVGSSFVIKETESGSAQATLTADEGPGTATITVGLDAETVSTTVIIESAPPTQSPTPTESPSETPTPTESPTPSPTESPTPTPTPTPTPSPSPSPNPTSGPTLVWGDHNCSDDPDPVDALLTLRHDAGLEAETNDCPEMGTVLLGVAATPLTWGDVDCEGNINPVDGLKILRYDAGLSVQQDPGCPDIGDTLVSP